MGREEAIQHWRFVFWEEDTFDMRRADQGPNSVTALHFWPVSRMLKGEARDSYEAVIIDHQIKATEADLDYWLLGSILYHEYNTFLGTNETNSEHAIEKKRKTSCQRIQEKKTQHPKLGTCSGLFQ
jgi:hypothetical protein